MKIVKKSLILLLVLLFIITQILIPLTIVSNSNINQIYKLNQIQNPKQELVSKKQKTNQVNENKWNIKIPSLELTAPIKEGTDQETLNQYVGHFECSGYISGNISLAAHNRGFPVNYFQDLKNIQIGDEIKYEYKNLELTYKVKQIKIIQDTDVYVVENTEKNKITLITCVENQPEKRICVQGILDT